MRRIVLFLISAMLLTGCTDGSGDSSPAPISSPAMAALGEALGSPTLGRLKVTKRGTVRLPRGMLTVATADSLQPFVSVSKLQTAVDANSRVAPKNFRVMASKGGKHWVLAYKSGPRSGDKRYFLFVTRTTARRVAADSHESPGSGGFTLYQIGGGDYVASLVYVGAANEYGLPSQYKLEAATYVELCQNELEASHRASDTAVGVSSVQLQQLGQETLCNSLGAALSMARAGVAYKTYLAVTRDRTLRVGAFRTSFLEFSEADYEEMK